MSNDLDLDELERLAESATPGPWVLWTGCSWRRFGSQHTGRTVCEPTNHHIDGHPDLSFRNDADARFMERFDPSTVLSLIQRIRDAERALADANAHVDELHGRLSCMLDEHDAFELNQAYEAQHMRKGGV